MLRSAHVRPTGLRSRDFGVNGRSSPGKQPAPGVVTRWTPRWRGALRRRACVDLGSGRATVIEDRGRRRAQRAAATMPTPETRSPPSTTCGCALPELRIRVDQRGGPLIDCNRRPHILHGHDGTPTFGALFTPDRPVISGRSTATRRARAQARLQRTNYVNFHARGFRGGHHHDAVRHVRAQRARTAITSPARSTAV